MNESIPLNIKKSIDELIIETKKMFENHLKKIILYGSYARGDYNSSSDIDIMILTDLNEKEMDYYREKIWDFAYDIELKNDVIISPAIRNINDYNERIEYIPFYYNIETEGVILHAA